ncbi:MAG: hypothetical protein KAJ20_03100 [Candidatus Aenigmarchaeota archaeon]|nr:hypothetical protein [Candidatus Aenigmarchaeota archaeon]MCK5235119.1 hypothetical protein [Candidatus Aenigmarchaeota archaeon]MCK5289948.1 hypothetical protein [Candidatus Aenigmarchaeota archaeon]MCK5373300.1 hypothetical protein [Candidatus Aenigmarchaeota archaeon]
MEVLSLEIIIDDKRTSLDALLKKAENIDSFEIEDLDKTDERKSVVLFFKEPININYINSFLISVLGEHKAKVIE